MTQIDTPPVESPPGRRPRLALGLLVLAPFSAEYLLGNISVRELPALPFLIPMYGGGALLIRELARRTGRGWPTILLLGLAYGVLQAGLVDASMFNSGYEGLDDLSAAWVPWLNFGGYFALAFVVNHAVLSIGSPIAVIEALGRRSESPSSGRRQEPWLGPVGLAVTVVLYLLGSLLIGWDSRTSEHFSPSGRQVVAAVLTATVLIAIAFMLPGSTAEPTTPSLGRRSLLGVPARTPGPLRAGTTVAVISAIFFVAPPNYFGVAFGLLLIAGTAALVIRWSRAPGWTDRQVLALAAGALFVSAWGAFAVGAFVGVTDLISMVGHVVFGLVALILLRVAFSTKHPPAQGLADTGAEDGS